MKVKSAEVKSAVPELLELYNVKKPLTLGVAEPDVFKVYVPGPTWAPAYEPVVRSTR